MSHGREYNQALPERGLYFDPAIGCASLLVDRGDQQKACPDSSTF
ncbi:MAG: hypothetical protein ACJ73N_15890 [Bryobacteraceae bacterium]